jgi:hypothetical protein
MLLIRDSVEPEDSFEDQDVFPPYPSALSPQATPITFDLPSATSAATQPLSTNIPTQKSKTPITTTIGTSTKPRRTLDANTNKDGDLWEFPIDTPERTTRRSTTTETRRTTKNSQVMEKRAVISKTTRRNSVCAVTERVGTRERTRAPSVEVDESPQIARKRKLTKRIEESDTERIDSPEPESQPEDEDFFITNGHKWTGIHVEDIAAVDSGAAKQLNENNSTRDQLHFDGMVAVKSNPRKKMIAVEIPSKSRRTSRTKTALKEIDVENIPAPDPSPVKIIIRHVTPEPPPQFTQNEMQLENVVLANVPQTTPPRQIFQQKTAVAISSPRPMNVASILAKSPNRPMYRVGLSRRVNVEPLHGYLRRNVS